jgi:hypothetical protein
MTLTSLEQQLDLLERQFNEVSFALIDGEPTAVQSSSAALQQLAVDFVQIADEFGHASVTQGNMALRLKALADGLPVLRENLLRRTSYVDRALQLVMPATQKVTYETSAGPYGGGVKQSGQMKFLAA